MSGVKLIGAVIAAGVLVVLAGVASFTSEQERSAAAAPSPPVEASQAQDQAVDPMFRLRAKGDADAPVTIYELSDFQCPWCRRFVDSTLPALEEEYIATGKVRFIFVNLPIPSLHPNAPAAHEFAMCAAAQEKFWPVHDLLFRHQDRWNRSQDPAPFFMSLADSAGLDGTALTECIDTGAMRPLVTSDMNTAMRGGVRSTPTFVIEGGVLPGYAPMETWRPILDSIVALKDAAN